MASLVELAVVAKSDPAELYGYGEPRRKIPGAGVAMAGGGALTAAGGAIALRSRRMKERSQADLRMARQRANDAQRASFSSPGNARLSETARMAARNAEVADLVANNAPKRAKFVRRFGGKVAAAGLATMAAGYGIKRLNDAP